MNRFVLNFQVDLMTEECKDDWGEDTWRDVPVLLLNGQEVWRGKKEIHGYDSMSQENAEQQVIDMFERLLNV